MPESECVCLKCFNVLDERKQKSLLKNSDVLQKPEILEHMARKEKSGETLENDKERGESKPHGGKANGVHAIARMSSKCNI